MNFVKELTENGIVILPEHYTIDDHLLEIANQLMTDSSYKIGRIFKTSSLDVLKELKNLIFNDFIKDIFCEFESKIKCQEVFISHEFKSNIKERNNYLHFDRLRCLKAMVYLKDIENKDFGPFSYVPKSNKKGYELRHSFKEVSNYENKKNRIDVDHKEIYEEPIPVLGKKGTLILFDTDTWHLGGVIKNQKERKVIRSHWFVDHDWRINS